MPASEDGVTDSSMSRPESWNGVGAGGIPPKPLRLPQVGTGMLFHLRHRRQQKKWKKKKVHLVSLCPYGPWDPGTEWSYVHRRQGKVMVRSRALEAELG